MYPFNKSHKQIEIVLRMYMDYLDISKPLYWCYAGQNKIWVLSHIKKWITLDLKEVLIELNLI